MAEDFILGHQHPKVLSPDLWTEPPEMIQDAFLHRDDLIHDDGLFRAAGRTQTTAYTGLTYYDMVGFYFNGVYRTGFGTHSAAYARIRTSSPPADRSENLPHVIALENLLEVAESQTAAGAAEANLKVFLVILLRDTLYDRLEFRPCTDGNESELCRQVELGPAFLHRGVPGHASGNHVSASLPEHDAAQIARKAGAAKAVPAYAAVHQDAVAGVLDDLAQLLDRHNSVFT